MSKKKSVGHAWAYINIYYICIFTPGSHGPHEALPLQYVRSTKNCGRATFPLSELATPTWSFWPIIRQSSDKHMREKRRSSCPDDVPRAGWMMSFCSCSSWHRPHFPLFLESVPPLCQEPFCFYVSVQSCVITSQRAPFTVGDSSMELSHSWFVFWFRQLYESLWTIWDLHIHHHMKSSKLGGGVTVEPSTACVPLLTTVNSMQRTHSCYYYTASVIRVKLNITLNWLN